MTPDIDITSHAQVLKESAAIRREQLACEISSLLKVHHPNIVQFLGACTREEPLMIVSELMEGAHTPPKQPMTLKHNCWVSRGTAARFAVMQ